MTSEYVRSLCRTDQTLSATPARSPVNVLRSDWHVATLWTSDHALSGVGLASTATDQCDGSPSVSVVVFGNEDDQTPTGDGTLFSPDAKNIAPGTLRLRNERIDSQNGRV